MRLRPMQVAAAAAVAGFLGFGGMSLAYAQDSGDSGSDPTVTTESPSATTDDGSSTNPDATTPDDGTDRREGCPEKDASEDGLPSTEGSSL